MLADMPDRDDAPDDATLMLRYASGDIVAFETLYGRHRGGLYRYLKRQCGNDDQAAELFQEVWARVVRGRAQYRPLARFNTWLYRLAHNVYVDHVRRSSRRPQLRVAGSDRLDTMDEVDAPVAAFAGASRDRPDAGAARDETARRILAAVAALPDKQREVFLLREETGMTLEEIAGATGTSRETVKSRLRYALARLRDALADCIGEEP